MLALPAPAAAAKPKKPCWQRLINDWYDGRIDKTYPAKCYRAAIRNLPDDAVQYSSAEEDFRRALLAALRDRRGGGNIGGPTDEIPIPPDPPATAATAKEDKGFFRELLERLGPKNADAVPVPLLVLAGIAFLLLGAATASYAARWLHARRVQLAPASAKSPTPRTAAPPQERS